jgi:DNA-binding transcriptional LysR family regulator
LAGAAASRSIRVHGRLVVNGFATAHEVALSGQGVAVLPAFLCAESLRSGALRRVLEAFTPAPTPLYAIHPKSPEVPARVRAFLDLLQRGTAAPWSARLRA